ncbi:hypothetical protein [Solicola gregarius]|uniref:LicD family protein n=1 Tax=Solicola gregarius TaxID=2908642 RepID=A0AA46TGU8_9ACTN|nr:hypothetical protein [Solicola gregarius]UYM05109.1 hypothetical protein L0C25_21725 [Solicola gregarius]
MRKPALYADVPDRVRARVMQAHREDARPDAEYEALRAALESVPKSERKLRWRQIDILLDVHFRQNGPRVVRRLARLREAHENRGTTDRYERLWASVQDLLGDVTVTAHGYNARPALHPADELWSHVCRVLDELRDAGYQAFANSGTLLGLVRDDGIIWHDDDVDLAVLLHADTTKAAAHEWAELRRKLAETGLLDLELDRRRTIHTKAASPDGLMLDLFPAWISDGRLYVFPCCFGEVAADDVIPLAPFAVGGSNRVPVPAHPEALLAVNYGDDWRTPDPLFAFDWTSAKRRFRRFRRIVRKAYMGK